MANYVLTCLLAAVVSCGIISVVTNLLSSKVGSKFKTILSLIIEVVVAIVIFSVNAVLADHGFTYTITSTIVGVIITVGFSQIAYSTIIKLFTTLIGKFKTSLK